MDLTIADKICIPPPLFHCFGLVLGCLACFTHGSAAVFASEIFDPLRVLKTVQEVKCTGLHGVPTMFIAEMEHPEFKKFDLSTLRTGIAAGSAVPSAVMDRIHKQLNLTQLTICYGMTETSPVSCQTTTFDPLEKRLHSVGRLLPNTMAKIVNPETNEICKVGERGELCVAGYLLMKGYYRDEAKTQQVMEIDQDGVRWMHTGDESQLDEQGYFSITGRIKDLIIRGKPKYVSY
jgi:acyl-CoA synthetase (AMP-forming)/AMP-acid ligase II